MRLPWALLLSAAALHVQAHVVVRQDGGNNPSGTSAAPSATSSNGNGGNNGGSSTSADTPTSSSGSNGGGGQDTTVFRTETVTDGNAETITSRTTARTTSTFTVVVISTLFQTSTLTQQGETATKTIYETTTVIDNNKRGLIDLGPRTLPIAVEAYPTEEPIPSVTSVDWNNLDMARNKMQRDNVLNKRATVTEVRTVTVGGNDSGTTVVNTVTQTVVVTTSVISTTTRQVTETDVQDAKTTQTVTSTLTVTSTAVTTGVQTTQTSENNNNDNNNNNNSNNNSDDGGLSTGAKAGIGAGVGVAGLLILGALAFFCIRRRRRGPKADPDAMAGASEVPVGGPVGGTPPMSHQGSTHHAAAAGLLSPHGRAPPTKTSPEGYRGTAMGDGRAGYAKPSPYGAAYTQPTSTSPTNRSSTLNSSSPFSPTGQTVSSMGADSLPSHPGPNDHTGAAELGNDGNAAAGRWQNPGAAEMDSTGIGHQSSAPPENVYEMPAQNYR